MHEMETINRRTWSDSSSLRLYGRSSGFSDAGEQAALEAIEPEIRGGDILDIGVGGGRTAAFLAPLAGRYVGVDYTPKMISLAGERFPGLSFIEADARDLSAFAPASFDLVVFSCNGIDAVDHESRARILEQCARVLREGGLLLYSTFNRDGPGFRDRRNNRKIVVSANPLQFGYSLAKYAVGGVLGWARIIERRGLECADAEHSILLHKAHDFGILVHAISLWAIPGEIARAGFDEEAVIFGSSGARVTAGANEDEEYVHVIARRASRLAEA